MEVFAKLQSNARFLARQGLAFHGEGAGSNFMQLIHPRSEDNAKLVDWIKKFKKNETDKYNSGDMQKEMVKVMALRVARDCCISCGRRSLLQRDI